MTCNVQAFLLAPLGYPWPPLPPHSSEAALAPPGSSPGALAPNHSATRHAPSFDALLTAWRPSKALCCLSQALWDL